MKLLALFIILCLYSTSCNKKTYTLSKDDRSWMPYKSDDVMVFVSNTGEEDSIYVLKFDDYETVVTTDDPNYQYFGVYCVNTKEELAEKGIWKGYRLLNIGSSEDGNYLHFDFHNRNAYFYDSKYPRIDSLAKADPLTLHTPFKTLDDVYKLTGKPYPEMPDSLRSIMITRFYWSKSHGLVRYDKLNGEQWELKQKFTRED